MSPMNQVSAHDLKQRSLSTQALPKIHQAKISPKDPKQAKISEIVSKMNLPSLQQNSAANAQAHKVARSQSQSTASPYKDKSLIKFYYSERQ